MTDYKQLYVELAALAKREHYYCEDSWYSCPKATDGCADDSQGSDCNCGADAHNAKVDALVAALAEPEPEEPTDEEIMELMPQQMHEDLAAAARAMAEQAGTDSTRARGVMRIILNRHSVDLARAVLARWGR